MFFMGFWINNFAEFELKRNRENRLVLNFSYVPDYRNGEKAEPKNVKVYVPMEIKVPTWFLPQSRVEEVIDKINRSENLGNLNFERKQKGRFEVIEVETPNIPSILDELKKLGFQTGNYTKMLRYGGFYPERKAVLEQRLLESVEHTGETEISFNDFKKIKFGDFLTLEEAKSLPYVVLDIEKPLWKKDREKELIQLRKKLLKAPVDERTLKRERIIGRIEGRLSWEDPKIGKVGFYEGRFNADVSYVGTTWHIGNREIKELYIVDPFNEVEEQEHNGVKIIKSKNEKELVNNLLSSFKERKPLVAIGHNQVYDYSQIRFAADENDVVFDPAVEDVRHRRDFVRDFLQRQREDLIYIDTLWFGRIKHPYLNQRRFGTSFKLAALANHVGIDFEKSLTHDQLREVEMRRLAGKTTEIRKEAANQMIDYTCSDIGGTEGLFEKLDPWPFLVEMKKTMPFCTYTQIAFSPNIINHLHEHRHFVDSGNLPYTSFTRVRRQEEIDFFKKKFPNLKEKRLRRAGIKKAHKGVYENVSEYYFSLESLFLDRAFFLNPELGEAYYSLKDSHEFAFLQYLRSYMVQIFSDYFQVNTQKEKISLDPKYNDGEKEEMIDSTKRTFYARYKLDPMEIRRTVKKAYETLAGSIRQNRMFYLDHIGDYIFVQGEGEITGARKIRTLESFAVE